ncbi:MAG TPA: formyltetrahydrofolate deformylase [Polyangiales bacterium]|nr:formyltetrahydrofolate deformylase [Polyangiales bacterium]
MHPVAPPQPADTATVLVSCPDRRGLVAALGQLLYGHGVNILSADQYTDPEANQFFQRIVVDLREMHADRLTLEHAIGEVAQRFSMRFRIAYGSHQKRVAIVVSKYDHCLHDLVLRKRSGELACEIPLIVSNHPDLEPVALSYGIPFRHFPITAADKHEQEARMMALFAEERIDLVVLARYMQIVSADFCARYAERAINIHHSFLPAFVGGKPYHQAHARGVKVVGATAHYVTVDLDEGPILEQDVMRVTHRDSVQDLIRKGRDLERIVLSRAVRYHLEDRVLVSGNKTVVFG